MAPDIVDIHERTDDRSRTEAVLVVAWLVGAGIVGAAALAVYAFAASPLFPDCGNRNDFLGGTYVGGAAADGSLAAALVIGIVLWLTAGAAAAVLRRALGLLFVGFSASYVVALVVL